MSTSTWISPFLALQVSGLLVSGLLVSGLQDQGVPDQHPYLPAEDVAAGDARPLH